MDAFSALLLLINIPTGVTYLMLASVLSSEFDDRGIKSYIYGFVIGSFALSSIVS